MTSPLIRLTSAWPTASDQTDRYSRRVSRFRPEIGLLLTETSRSIDTYGIAAFSGAPS
ncbi:hypothetical protein D3C81_2179990 [compost metagenome]